MTDLEIFLDLLNRNGISSDVSDEKLEDSMFENVETVVRVHGGYRCHFEAEFNKDGKLLSMGQWDEY
jgi:hypothetical protein